MTPSLQQAVVVSLGARFLHSPHEGYPQHLPPACESPEAAGQVSICTGGVKSRGRLKGVKR